MIRLHKLLILGLFVFLAASPRARSQTLQGGQLTTQADTRKAATTKHIRSLVRAGGATKESPELSFQPGIGWQHAPTGKLSTSDTPGNGVLGGIGANKPAAGRQFTIWVRKAFQCKFEVPSGEQCYLRAADDGARVQIDRAACIFHREREQTFPRTGLRILNLTPI